MLREQPDLINQAVEELLRYDGPAKAVVRIAAEDIEMGDTTIKAGDRVFLMLSGANHDPEVFDDPDQLDILRKRGPHLGFRTGVHYCLGAILARLEDSSVLSRITERRTGSPNCRGK